MTPSHTLLGASDSQSFTPRNQGLPPWSGVAIARLGHTGARALATRGHAPPVKVCMPTIGAESSVVDLESGAKQS